MKAIDLKPSEFVGLFFTPTNNTLFLAEKAYLSYDRNGKFYLTNLNKNGRKEIDFPAVIDLCEYFNFNTANRFELRHREVLDEIRECSFIIGSMMDSVKTELVLKELTEMSLVQYGVFGGIIGFIYNRG